MVFYHLRPASLMWGFFLGSGVQVGEPMSNLIA